jgi:aarF domain-containing kinase
MGHVIRFFQLLIIFSPVILLYPFRKLKVINNLWMDMCVKSVENAGVVWIKIFQYLSHRRDIIGDEMSQKFGHLRENAPQHSFEETRKSFENYYGKKIE